MLLQWRYQSRPDLGILALAGLLGARDVPRLHGAIGWTLYHGAGPLILDLSGLHRWTSLGQDAIVKAALRLHAVGRTLEIADSPGGDTSIITGSEHPVIRVHADLTSALTVHGVTADAVEDQREWRSGGWPQDNIRNTRALAES